MQSTLLTIKTPEQNVVTNEVEFASIIKRYKCPKKDGIINAQTE